MALDELAQKLGLELDIAKENCVQETYVITGDNDSIYISENIDSMEVAEYPFVISAYTLHGMAWIIRKIDAICGVKYVKFENGSIYTRDQMVGEDV